MIQNTDQEYWIDLVNAIRLRKQVKGIEKYGLAYSIIYQHVNESYQMCSFSVSAAQGDKLTLTYIYDHKITEGKCSSSYNVTKNSSPEFFYPHVRGGTHPTRRTAPLNYITDDRNVIFKLGFYAAAFFYALNLKHPILKLLNNEWVVIDNNLGSYDFETYFRQTITIPFELPLPPVIVKTKNKQVLSDIIPSFNSEDI